MGLDTLFKPALGPPAAAVHRRRKVVAPVLALLLAVVLALGAVTLAVALLLSHQLDGQVKRLPDAFTGLEDRPVKPARGTAARAVNLLVVGSDRRSAVPTTGTRAEAVEWLPGDQRSDALMLVHVAGDRKSAAVVSLPRDSWVEIPGHGKHKINAALSYAGPALTVHTFERLTGVRVDHLAVIDWAGFRRLTDVLGGVAVEVPQTVHDSISGRTWTAGRHRLDGDLALQYVRQRYGLPGGDFDRIHRQQNLVRALLRQLSRLSVLRDPVTTYRVLDSLTENLSVDSGWSIDEMQKLARSLGKMRARDFHFTTAPVRGTGRVGRESVVFLDRSAGRELWRAIAEDRAAEWFREHPGARLQAVVR